MKSKTKKSDKKSTASRGQGSTQHRLTSGVRTPSPTHDTPLSTAVVTPDASPLPGGHSLAVRIASKNPGRKSCEPTGNGRLLKEGSEVTGSESVGTSLVLVEGSDTVPEVVEGPEMKQSFISVEGSGNSHPTLPTKRMKMMNRVSEINSSNAFSSTAIFVININYLISIHIRYLNHYSYSLSSLIFIILGISIRNIYHPNHHQCPRYLPKRSD